MSNVNAGFSPAEFKGGAIPLSASPLVGGRRGKKLRVVKKGTVKKLLRRFGMKMRGMGEPVEGAMGAPSGDAPAGDAPAGGRRRRGSRKTRRGSRKSRR